MISAEETLDRLDEEGVRVTLIRRPGRSHLALEFPVGISEGVRRTIRRVVHRRRLEIALEIQRRAEQVDRDARDTRAETRRGHGDTGAGS